MDIVSFPNLGIEIPVSSVAFEIFGLSIHWYGLIIASGVLIAMMVTYYLTKYYPKVEKDPFIDVVLVAVFFGFIGARIYYVIFSLDMYKDNWLDIFKVWEGGLGIYGGVIGALIAAVVMCRIRKVDIPSFVDLGGIGLLIGQMMGRWGNFFNQEAFGDNTNSLFGMTSDKISAYLTRNQASLEAMGTTVDPSLPVHPTFLYESVWCFIGLIIALFMVKRRKFNGQIFAFYIAWYSFGRFFIEGLRTDSLMIGPLKASQIVAVVGVVAGIAIFILGNKRAKSLGLKPLSDIDIIADKPKETDIKADKDNGETKNGDKSDAKITDKSKDEIVSKEIKPEGDASMDNASINTALNKMMDVTNYTADSETTLIDCDELIAEEVDDLDMDLLEDELTDSELNKDISDDDLIAEGYKEI